MIVYYYSIISYLKDFDVTLASISANNVSLSKFKVDKVVGALHENDIFNDNFENLLKIFEEDGKIPLIVFIICLCYFVEWNWCQLGHEGERENCRQSL